MAQPTMAESPVAKRRLSADEERIAVGIREHVKHLSIEIGERNPAKMWELAEAADYLAGQLEGLGYGLERQGYETEEVAAQNLAVTVQGGARGDEILIVGAHYDTRVGDGLGGSSETAALLELARLMRDARLERTLRIVFFSMGEQPHGNGEARGALHYAREVSKRATKKSPRGELDPSTQFSRTELLGSVLLHEIGPFASAAGRSPSGAVYVHALATPGTDRISDVFSRAFDEGSLRMATGELVLDGPESDATVFYEAGIPTVLLTGNPRRMSRPDPADADEVAQFVMRLRHAIGEFLGEKPTNDGIVTPLLGTSG